MDTKRRRMMKFHTVPEGYTEIEYIQRTGLEGTAGIISTGFTIDTTKTSVYEIGIMPTAIQNDNYAYPIACRQASGSDTFGYGIYVVKNVTGVASYNGASAYIEPNGGAAFTNMKVDLTSSWYPTGTSLTDGIHSDDIVSEPRTIYGNITLFGLHKQNGRLGSIFVGNIYYLRIYENNVLKVDMIPCRRLADSKIGFYDLVADTFRVATNYTAGPDI